MKRSPLRIALVNDYEIVLAGIREMLAPYAEQVDVVEMDANADVITPVDIALYDTYGQSSRALQSMQKPLNERKVDKVVLFTWNHTQALVDAAEEAGVDGLLSKTLPAEELVSALQRIADGERLITPSVRITTNTTRRGSSKTDWPGRELGLTMRESEMITMITQGMSNAEIAEHTYLSPNSVKSYIRSAYRKIGVKRRSQAVAWGIEHGMLPDRSRSIIV
ncbi:MULTISPECIES: response regulator transcription factor [unclassified Luteococcus]|uniref:response regulator transcription factor n=1 Tax=unclassified Luteococcus TaxID=2639923 RepID=UPI00313DCDC0